MSFYHHPEEEHQVGALTAYENARPDSRHRVEFAEGEMYACRYDTSHERENGGELDIEMDGPLFDEDNQVCMEIIEVVQKGLRPYNEWLSLDCRGWPDSIRTPIPGQSCVPPTDASPDRADARPA